MSNIMHVAHSHNRNRKTGQIKGPLIVVASLELMGLIDNINWIVITIVHGIMEMANLEYEEVHLGVI